MPFDLSQYEPVEERLARFWADHPKGRIHTELVLDAPSIKSVVMLASVWKNKTDPDPDATGYAQETQGEGMVNKTSWIENCETSAIGRALANMGYAPKGARPSREEMSKSAASRPTPPLRKAASRTKPRACDIALFEACKELDISDELRHRITLMLMQGATQSTKDLEPDQVDKITAQIRLFAAKREDGMAVLQDWEAKQS